MAPNPVSKPAPVYGNNGNRWWVAYNTSQQDSTAVGTSVGHPFSTTPSGYESLPSGDAADDKQFAQAARATARKAYPAGKGPTISVHNITWANVNGPYNSQSAANAAIPAIQKNEPAPSTQQVYQNNIPGAAAISSVADFLQGLTSANLWIRVAKIVVGGAILLIGLAKITGADKAIGGVAKKAVAVAPFL
jgi:hypothetical protein